MKEYVIGVDIGSTNTDAVVINKRKEIIAAEKVLTTQPLCNGLVQALECVIKKSAIDPSAVEAVVLGTTHATNAILQREGLYKVGLIRLAGHNPSSLPPAYDWPADLRNAIIVQEKTLEGGFECDGNVISSLNVEQVRETCKMFLAQGVESIAVTGVFSPLFGGHESAVRDIIKEVAGASFPVSLSCEVGTLGFVERENATILNAALKKCIQLNFEKFSQVCASLTSAPLFITQNNGTLMSLQDACAHPVLTIAAGPTNSCVGGARLAGFESAIVVDIGGTSTDVGIVLNGFARRSLNISNIGGVDINFSMPDIISIALGGGSLISTENAITIGPKSCGYLLSHEAQSFGGASLTLTDCAAKLGFFPHGTIKPDDIAVTKEQAAIVFELAKRMLVPLISKMAGRHKDLPVVFVGGGASLFPKDFFVANAIVPQYANVANAYGAACARIAATVDTIVTLDSREIELERLCVEAFNRTRMRGANEKTIGIVQKEIIPFSYIPGNKARVIITAVGERLW